MHQSPHGAGDFDKSIHAEASGMQTDVVMVKVIVFKGVMLKHLACDLEVRTVKKAVIKGIMLKHQNEGANALCDPVVLGLALRSTLVVLRILQV